MAHFTMPWHVFTGCNALKEAIPYIKECGSRAFIVTGKHVGKSSMTDRLKTLLEKENISFYVYDGITGEPDNEMISEGVKLYNKYKCNFCIGIGGGSPLDSAKAIAAMSVNDGSIEEYIGKEIKGNVPPVVAIPTTAGTGSEATKFTVITDKQKDVKMLLKGDCIVPKIAVVESDFTMDMPKSVTAATGMDALTHAVEAYTSKKAGPLTDVLAVSAIKRIFRYLPAAFTNGNDALAREQMAIAALEAGVCINNSSVTIVHGMSRPIGALFHVSHGISNAILIADCLSFVMDGAYDRFAKLARETGVADDITSDKEASEQLIKKIEEVCSVCQIPTLTGYGIDKDEFYEVIDKMAEDAIASGSPANTIKSISKEDCITIYKRIIERR